MKTFLGSIGKAAKWTLYIFLGLVLVATLTVLQTKWENREPFATPPYYRTLVGATLWSMGATPLRSYANFYTHWDGSFPAFRSSTSRSEHYQCSMQERTIEIEEYWQKVGDLNHYAKLVDQMKSSPKLFLRLNLSSESKSTYSLALDKDFTLPLMKQVDISLPIESGSDKYICLAHVGLPDSSDTSRSNWFCAASFNPNAKELRLLALNDQKSPSWPKTATFNSGVCVELPSK